MSQFILTPFSPSSPKKLPSNVIDPSYKSSSGKLGGLSEAWILQRGAITRNFEELRRLEREKDTALMRVIMQNIIQGIPGHPQLCALALAGKDYWGTDCRARVDATKFDKNGKRYLRLAVTDLLNRRRYDLHLALMRHGFSPILYDPPGGKMLAREGNLVITEVTSAPMEKPTYPPEEGKRRAKDYRLSILRGEHVVKKQDARKWKLVPIV